MRNRLLVIAVALASLLAGLALPHLHAEQTVIGTDGVGRYQLVRVGDNLAVMIDTRTGRTWQRFISTSPKAGQWDEITVEELAGKGK